MGKHQWLQWQLESGRQYGVVAGLKFGLDVLSLILISCGLFQDSDLSCAESALSYTCTLPLYLGAFFKTCILDQERLQFEVGGHTAVSCHQYVLVFRGGSLSCSVWSESLLSGKSITLKYSLNHQQLSLGWYSGQEIRDHTLLSQSYELDDPLTKEAFRTIVTHQGGFVFCWTFINSLTFLYFAKYPWVYFTVHWF